MIYINLLAKLFKLNNLNHNGENSFTTFLTTRGRTQIKFRTLFTVGQDTIVSPKFAHSSIELLDKRTWETSYFPSRTRQDLFAKQPTGRNFSIQKKSWKKVFLLSLPPTHTHFPQRSAQMELWLVRSAHPLTPGTHPPTKKRVSCWKNFALRVESWVALSLYLIWDRKFSSKTPTVWDKVDCKDPGPSVI